MVQFEKTFYNDGKKVTTRISRATYQEAYQELRQVWQNHHEATSLEERAFANGALSITVKDRSNKIIVQFKTVKDERDHI